MEPCFGVLVLFPFLSHSLFRNRKKKALHHGPTHPSIFLTFPFLLFFLCPVEIVKSTASLPWLFASLFGIVGDFFPFFFFFSLLSFFFLAFSSTYWGSSIPKGWDCGNGIPFMTSTPYVRIPTHQPSMTPYIRPKIFYFIFFYFYLFLLLH